MSGRIGRLGGTAVVLLAASAIPAFVARGAVEDVVYLKPRTEGGSATRLTGRIVDYTSRELRMLVPGGRERSIPSDQVAQIHTSRRAEQLAGDRELARGDFAAALDQYRQALSAAREPRDWMRREILAQVVWCQRHLGQYDQAGEYFLILLSRAAETRFFDCIPLAWSDEPPSPAAVQKAQGWLAEGDQWAALLMGASILLSTDERARAVEVLKRLAASSDARIAWLAQAQLWRAAAPGATLEKLRQWSAAIESSDESLRAGAYFVVGSAWSRFEPEAAALLLLKVPILYEREYHLAARSLLTAGGCLEKAGRASQAARLYHEVTRRYDQAPEAGEARRRLDGLASAAPARDN